MKATALLLFTAAACSAAPLKNEILVGAPVGSESAIRSPAGPFESPFGIDFDKAGNGYVVELSGGRVWKLPAGGGKPQQIAGKKDTKSYTGDGGPAADATFNGMHNCAVANDGDLLIADSWNHCVRQIESKTGAITTFAGTGEAGFAGDGGGTGDAKFNFVMCISLDPAKETLYITDLKNRRIRAIDMKSKIVRTVAGNGEKGVPKDGAIATDSPLVDPRAAAADADGNVWILERGGHALRKVSPGGKIETVAGTGKKGFKDGPALEAQLAGPKHLCFDGEGRVIIADEQNKAIRAYDPKTKTLVTILGRGVGAPVRQLSRPHGVAYHDGKLYVVDTGHRRILVER